MTPLTILRGRRFDSDGDGDIDENDIDTSHQTREFTYSAETVADIPAVRIDVRYTDSGITTLSWSFSLARSTNGAVYVVKYADGGPFDFTAGVAGAEPVLFLPYDSTGTLAAGMTYQGGFNHQFTPLLTWSVEAVDVTSPLGLSNTTDLRVDMGTATDRHYWFSNSDGFVETDDGFSLALTPPG